MNERIDQLLDQIRVNEQIERLAQEAGCTIDRLGYGEGNLEKFAELIVRECERVAKDGTWYYDAPSCGWRNPINHVCNVMKEHFGVEE